MREVVKYGNKFNRIRLSGFTRPQANIFFAIISRMRDKGTQRITFSYHRLAQLSGIHYGRRLGLFNREIQSTYRKILHLGIYQNNKHRYVGINLFSAFIVDKDRKECTVKVNPDFADLLNHLAKQFTRFSLSQYTTLKSRYAKALFRYIKTFRTTGNVYLPIKKFRRLLSIPKSYTNHQITQRVITPAKIQLTPLVRGLHIITQRKGSGNRVTGYHIMFKPDNPEYDKLAGFQSKIGSKKWKLENIKYSQWLTTKQKLQAERNVTGHKHHQHNRYSMKEFNKMLDTASLKTLRWYLSLHETKSPTVNFSEYQVRKLKKEIIKRHNRRTEQTKLF